MKEEQREKLKAYARQYSKDNKEKRSAYNYRYYREHKEEIREYNRKYRAEHQVESRSYYQTNKEKMKANAVAARLKKPELYRKSQRAYYYRNRDEINRKRREERALKKLERIFK